MTLLARAGDLATAAVPATIPSPRILVIGYGNPGRQDDGLGPAAASEIEKLKWPNMTTAENYQLVIEDAVQIAAHDSVWFIDAAREGDAPCAIRRLSPALAITFTSHLLKPEALLAIAVQYFGKSPEAHLLSIRGYELDFLEGLSEQASSNLSLAVALLRRCIGSPLQVSRPNIGLGDKRRTILIVDSDPHARAVLRNALEAADFTVGEAASGREGERTAFRIKPDAVLIDLLMEEVEASDVIADKMQDIGSRIPIYIVSTAGDALVGAVGLHELGVAGVFLKPVEPSVIAQTLKTRLGVA